MNGLIIAFVVFICCFGAINVLCLLLERAPREKKRLFVLAASPSYASSASSSSSTADASSSAPPAKDDSKKFDFSTVPEFRGSGGGSGSSGKNAESKESQGVARGAVEAVHELHVFMFVNPTDEQKEQYKARVADWNARVLPQLQQRDSETDDYGRCKVVHTAMKAPVLTLWFRDGKGTKPVTVCQSARHVQCNNRVKVVELCEEDKQFFENTGAFATSDAIAIPVVRQKIEACAYGIDGVPQTAADAARFPRRYFEVHIRTHKKDKAAPLSSSSSSSSSEEKKPQPITKQEENDLKEIANRLSVQLGIPIPLSVNTAKEGWQRFLNARFYGVGMIEIEPMLVTIRDAIEESGVFLAEKCMSTMEYVWFDSYKAMDSLWIDYSPEEMREMMARLENDEKRLRGGASIVEQLFGSVKTARAAAITVSIVAIFVYYAFFQQEPVSSAL